MANKELGNTAVCMEEYAWKGLDTFDIFADFRHLEYFSLLVKKKFTCNVPECSRFDRRL